MVLCDEVGTILLVGRFGGVKPGLMRLLHREALTVVNMIVRVSSTRDIPGVLATTIDGEAFLVHVHWWPKA